MWSHQIVTYVIKFGTLNFVALCFISYHNPWLWSFMAAFCQIMENDSNELGMFISEVVLEYDFLS